MKMKNLDQAGVSLASPIGSATETEIDQLRSLQGCNGDPILVWNSS